MKRSLVRRLFVGVLAGVLMVGTPLFSATASAAEWAKSMDAVPSWAIPTPALRASAMIPSAAYNGPLKNLTNTGRLKAEEMAFYGVWVFPGQRLDIRLSTSADFILLLGDDTDVLEYSNSVRGGTESISYNYTDYGTGPQVLWIAVGAYDAGSYTLRTSMTDAPVSSALSRIAGADRYATAVKASQDAFSGADTVIIATGANFPDALAAAGLCGVYDAPLLLVPAGSLPSVVSTEINRLGATEAIIIGGTASVSSAVQNALSAKPALAGNVSRIAGTDRYHTARLVAEAMHAELGTPLPKAIVVCGTNYADALSASPLAYADNRPILLTPTKSAHSAVLNALTSIGATDVTIIGGTTSVSANAEQQIESKLGTLAQRWAGVDRFDTARIVAQNSVADGELSRDFIGYSYGYGFPDGLSGGVACGRKGGALLLTMCWAEPDAMQEYNKDSNGVTRSARVFGGPGVVWGNVLGMINEDIEFVGP